jgi:hypothetical protein
VDLVFAIRLNKRAQAEGICKLHELCELMVIENAAEQKDCLGTASFAS